MNIGLLEDNMTIVTLLTTMLEMAGHHVFSFTEGRSLLDTFFPLQLAMIFSLLILAFQVISPVLM